MKLGVRKYVRDPAWNSKYGSDRAAWGVSAHAWNITVCDFPFSVSSTRLQVATVDRFSRSIRQTTRFHARKCLLGSRWWIFTFFWQSSEWLKLNELSLAAAGVCRACVVCVVGRRHVFECGSLHRYQSAKPTSWLPFLSQTDRQTYLHKMVCTLHISNNNNVNNVSITFVHYWGFLYSANANGATAKIIEPWP